MSDEPTCCAGSDGNHSDYCPRNATNTPSELAPASGSALETNYEFDPESPCCTSCGEFMRLGDGLEWSEDNSLNVCGVCAIGMVKDLRSENRKLAETISRYEEKWIDENV